jgi:hypothetical protein
MIYNANSILELKTQANVFKKKDSNTLQLEIPIKKRPCQSFTWNFLNGALNNTDERLQEFLSIAVLELYNIWLSTKKAILYMIGASYNFLFKIDNQNQQQTYNIDPNFDVQSFNCVSL